MAEIHGIAEPAYSRLSDLLGSTIDAGTGGAVISASIPPRFHRVSNVISPEPLPADVTELDMNSVLVKTFTGPMPDASAAWTDEWRQACIGAANGGGWGGSAVIDDVDRKISFADVVNRMDNGLLGDTRGSDLATAA